MWLQDIALRRIDDGFVDQHDWDAVPYRVNAVALAALQTLSVVFQRQRLFADRADQDVEQVLGNHAMHSIPFIVGSRKANQSYQLSAVRQGGGPISLRAES